MFEDQSIRYEYPRGWKARQADAHNMFSEDGGELNSWEWWLYPPDYDTLYIGVIHMEEVPYRGRQPLEQTLSEEMRKWGSSGRRKPVAPPRRVAVKGGECMVVTMEGPGSDMYLRDWMEPYANAYCYRENGNYVEIDSKLSRYRRGERDERFWRNQGIFDRFIQSLEFKSPGVSTQPVPALFPEDWAVHEDTSARFAYPKGWRLEPRVDYDGSYEGRDMRVSFWRVTPADYPWSNPWRYGAIELHEYAGVKRRPLRQVWARKLKGWERWEKPMAPPRRVAVKGGECMVVTKDGPGVNRDGRYTWPTKLIEPVAYAFCYRDNGRYVEISSRLSAYEEGRRDERFNVNLRIFERFLDGVEFNR